MDNKIKGAKGKSQIGPSNYEIANELPLSLDELKQKETDKDKTIPYKTYTTLKEQYYTALKDAEHYKRLWENAYTDPEHIKLWSCIKHKLFGISKTSMARGIFGHISIWNINNHRDSYPWNDRKDMKIRWIFHYLTPSFLSKHLESIDFYNIYDISETGEKQTSLVIAGTENLYILYFRKKKEFWGKEDWHWCLKFEKRKNDHCGSC